jgi:hypothetical protein
MPVILSAQEAEIRRITVQIQPWSNSLWDPILKNPTQNRADGMAEVVECLPSKCEALSSNSSTNNNKKRELN